MAAPLASLGLFRTDLLVLVCLVADKVRSFIYLGGVAVLMRWGLAVPRQRGLQILFYR
ncbi:hypothetical protein A2U01_0074631 [Trifolium medium]|uniref:Uncharacterized protein n=1 Tax=Trifolium medium TaxID=97028 RepID=A0A392SZ93_9FABA|nr:hypothetical protein [Trifolium medium]